MSLGCGVECVVVLGCVRWAWKRCTYVGADDSATWTDATADEFRDVPHVCRLILAVYEDDLHHPKFPPPDGYRLDPDCVVKRVTYEQTQGRAPPYLIYLDHERRQIVLAMRGLNLARESDYKLLLDNKLGMQMFDGGYVHHGLLKSALWVLERESEVLRQLWVENGRSYGLVFAGHSLGSGVAALMTVVVVNHRDMIGGIPREKVRCYAVAPARCMSLNLAVKYADVIYSIVLQVVANVEQLVADDDTVQDDDLLANVEQVVANVEHLVADDDAIQDDDLLVASDKNIKIAIRAGNGAKQEAPQGEHGPCMLRWSPMQGMMDTTPMQAQWSPMHGRMTQKEGSDAGQKWPVRSPCRPGERK